MLESRRYARKLQAPTRTKSQGFLPPDTQRTGIAALATTPTHRRSRLGKQAQRLIPVRFWIRKLAHAAGWRPPSLRTTRSRLITPLRRPPALRSYALNCESVSGSGWGVLPILSVRTGWPRGTDEEILYGRILVNFSGRGGALTRLKRLADKSQQSMCSAFGKQCHQPPPIFLTLGASPRR
jgi:hypothetical protein